MSWQVPPRVSAAIIVIAVVGFGVAGVLHLRRNGREDGPPTPKIHVPLWTDPGQVQHRSRFAFAWDDPAALAPFRQTERLDDLVAAGRTDEERARLVLHWAARQFEAGTPSPYPPPDAETLLTEIRSGRTQGFCAQYSFVIVQALQSMGAPARMVTLEKHEVVETWLADERRWVMLDGLFDMQVLDASGRSLSALEIRDAAGAGRKVIASPGSRLTEDLGAYCRRYDQMAIWIRNTFTSSPMNFADFDRYRVWLEDGVAYPIPPDSLSTTHPAELYGPPEGWPG